MSVIALLLGLVAAAEVVAPPQVLIELTVYTGDPLGSKHEGTVAVLSAPRLVTASGRPGFVRVGQEWKVTRPDGTDATEWVGVTVEVLPIIYPGGVWLEMTASQRDVSLGLGIRTDKGVEPGFTEQSARVAVMTKSGEVVRRRIGARSPADQTWVEVTVRPVN